MAKDSGGKVIKIGDTVGFKSDFEQSGEVIKINGDKVMLYNENGFGGEYLRYATTTWEEASRCWIE
jgi:hypothetical protein